MNGFFGIGIPEMLVVGVLALIFIGPEKLPGVIAQVMKTIRELRDYATDVQRELADELAPLREDFEGLTREVNEFAQDVTASVNEVAAETQAVTAEADPRPAFNELMAPPPPRDPIATLAVPAGAHTNGVARDDEDSRPAFGDFRPE